MAQQIGKRSQNVTTPTGSTRIMQLGQDEADRSSYKSLDESLKMLKGDSKVLGALQILNGSMIFALGMFLGLLQHASNFPRNVFFMTVYTGYPFWGAASFIISGSLSIAAKGKPTRNLVQSSFGMNIASATISFIGVLFLLINFVLNSYEIRSCSLASPNVCTVTSSTSTGLLSLILILTVLEFCITISFTILGCKANCCEPNEVVLSLPDSSVVAGIPPVEQHSEGMETSVPMNDTEILST
ncbi:membrane-spanning 4-domains subfamily A member 3 [Trichosurus vulpecula]|uniref:membrane-spanning 4-domains subfamily A member 3 n=1 Tax=Trichosurus vulpecula TaxID=9337 RepID=UPI00186B08B7|nr:membrane-spanning 4-domains subfamily A member 3 [Trichosurus vulpecula]